MQFLSPSQQIPASYDHQGKDRPRASASEVAPALLPSETAEKLNELNFDRYLQPTTAQSKITHLSHNFLLSHFEALPL